MNDISYRECYPISKRTSEQAKPALLEERDGTTANAISAIILRITYEFPRLSLFKAHSELRFHHLVSREGSAGTRMKVFETRPARRHRMAQAT